MPLGVRGLTPQLASYQSSDADLIENIWVERISARVSFDRAVTAPVQFTFAAAKLGPVAVGRHRPHVDLRVRDDDGDFYFFAVARTGYTGMEQGGRLHRTGAGRAVAHHPWAARSAVTCRWRR